MVEPLLTRFQSEWGKRFKLVGVNADENLKLSSQYQIKTLPTLLLFERGQVIHRLEGLYRRDDLWKELQRFMFAEAPLAATGTLASDLEQAK